MSHQIEVDDEVFAYLQGLARPFVDTPNSILRRSLGLDRISNGVPEGLGDRPSGTEGAEEPVRMGRQAALPMTPQKDFRPVIRDVLLEAGGGQAMNEVLSQVEARMGPRFLPGDRAAVSTGEVRWRNAARWERMQMAKEGLIKRGTRSGWWELTDDGRSA